MYPRSIATSVFSIFMLSTLPLPALAATATATATPSPTISASPSATTTATPIAQAEVVFSDITKDHWAYNSVQTVVQAKIMNGYGDSTFRPDQPITRAETTKVIALAVGKGDIKKPTTVTLPFTDITRDDPLIPYIQHSYENRIIKGYNDNTFRPAKPVTRAEFLKIFMLAANSVFKDYNTGEAFLDVGAAHDLASYIYSARALGYIKGTSNGLFYPNTPITRAEAAKIIYAYVADKKQQFPELSELEKKMFEEINNKRKSEGKAALIIDNKLSGIARKQSQELFEQWHFLSKQQKKEYEASHANQIEQDKRRPWTSHRNASGLTFDQWFALASKKYDINYSEATQNIAHAFFDSATPIDRVVDIINKMFEKGSDNSFLYAHAYNLLGSYVSYTHIGLGVVVGDDPEEMYVTQILTK
ncbi:MAG: S-layer homology domain-containing protein [Candidatus Abawacabacteria bacterium]|nr:S-layer homology domain-containing protein [Candidatus Abawacabacteria bacterium]